MPNLPLKDSQVSKESYWFNRLLSRLASASYSQYSKYSSKRGSRELSTKGGNSVYQVGYSSLQVLSSMLKTLKAAINISKLVIKVLKLLAIVANKCISSLDQGSNSPFSKVIKV